MVIGMTTSFSLFVFVFCCFFYMLMAIHCFTLSFCCYLYDHKIRLIYEVFTIAPLIALDHSRPVGGFVCVTGWVTKEAVKV